LYWFLGLSHLPIII